MKQKMLFYEFLVSNDTLKIIIKRHESRKAVWEEVEQ
jgi:hypothetical protein